MEGFGTLEITPRIREERTNDSNGTTQRPRKGGGRVQGRILFKPPSEGCRDNAHLPVDSPGSQGPRPSSSWLARDRQGSGDPPPRGEVIMCMVGLG